MGYDKTTWVDDDGSGVTGTEVTAAVMNNIEEGIEDMHLAFDAVSNVAAATGNLSWEHDVNAQANVRGVLVLIVQNGTATDQISNVTYGGTSMREVDPAGLLHSSGSEDGAIYAYFLGTFVPQGNQTVNVTVSGSDVKRAVCYTMTAPGDLTVQSGYAESANMTNPSAGPTLRQGTEALVFSALHSGYDSTSSIALAQTGTTEDLAHDFGSQIAAWQHTDTPVQSGTLGWTAAGGEEAAILTLAVRPIADYGLVLQLPSYGVQGDKCQVQVDDTQGVVWSLVHNGMDIYPWKYVGGPPLYSQADAYTSVLTSAYVSGAGVPTPSAIIPLDGDYMISQGGIAADFLASAQTYVSHGIGPQNTQRPSGADADAWIKSVQYNKQVSGMVIVSMGTMSIERKAMGLAATQRVIQLYRVAAQGNLQIVGSRWLKLLPIRLR